MRICRFRERGDEAVRVGFYDDQRVLPLAETAAAAKAAGALKSDLVEVDDLLAYLPPSGAHQEGAAAVAKWLASSPILPAGLARLVDQVDLLLPIPRPNKLFLLAGNYAAHIEEGGGIAAERRDTFPYVFIKPPTTTLTNPGQPASIPSVSPDAIDWELELGVVIGLRCKSVKEADALKYVAGYTVINDLSNRRFKPNPTRKKRDRDAFFDWLHGKWHDGFCPCGPCIVSAAAMPDPQTIDAELKVNGHTEQKFTTKAMVFPVAAVIEFIASFVTLEPGDIIATGTGPGVGSAKNKFLKAGDSIEARLSGIGVLRTTMVSESERGAG